jgi:hypothetical protein
MGTTISVGAGAVRNRKRLGLFGLVALAATLAAALLGAGAAQAASSATVAPIGSASSGSYFVTVEYEARETDGVIGIEFSSSEEATGIVPSECKYGIPVSGTLVECPQHHAGGKIEVCYNGPAPSQVEESFQMKQIPLATVGAVASCPVAGFVPRSPTTGGGSSGGSGGNGGGSATGSSSIKLGKVTDNSKKGTATLAVSTGEPGTIKLSGKQVKSASVKAKKAGTFQLLVKAKGGAVSTLAEQGTVKVKVLVTFTPTGGKPVTDRKTVKLEKK